MALRVTWYRQRPLARSTAPKTVRRRFLPGVMTCWRVPRAIQVARTHASRLRWVSSSASTTAPWGSPAMAWRSVARTWSRPPRAWPVGQPEGAVLAVAVDPAAHGRRVVAEQAGDLRRGPALLGQQQHHQAAGDTVGTVQQPQQIAGVAGGTGRVGVHGRGTHTGGGLVGSLWLQAPTTREATASARRPSPMAIRLRAELLVTCLAVLRCEEWVARCRVDEEKGRAS